MNNKNASLSLLLRKFQWILESYTRNQGLRQINIVYFITVSYRVLCSPVDRGNSFLPAEAMTFYVQHFPTGWGLSSSDASQTLLGTTFLILARTTVMTNTSSEAQPKLSSGLLQVSTHPEWSDPSECLSWGLSWTLRATGTKGQEVDAVCSDVSTRR